MTTDQPRKAPETFHVDTHVHLHPAFDIAAALTAVCRHMWSTSGVLMLTEIEGVNRFAELKGAVGDWAFTRCDEACSVWAHDAQGKNLLIIAGHQLVTAEGLEVLMLGALTPAENGQSLPATLDAVTKAGALAVLPWGVGKWTGRRGKLIADLVQTPPAANVYLADSGVRPRGSRRPALFSAAEASGWRILAGTDPLPFKHQVGAVGRYGNVLEEQLDHRAPFASVSSALSNLTQSPETYGSLQGLAGFLTMQVAMQVRKRLGTG